jgi:hypothetical protein
LGEAQLDLSRFAEPTQITEKLKLMQCQDDSAYIEIQVKSKEAESIASTTKSLRDSA